MINFNGYWICFLVLHLQKEETEMASRVSVHDYLPPTPPQPPPFGGGLGFAPPEEPSLGGILGRMRMPYSVPDEDKTRMKDWLGLARKILDGVDLDGSLHRIGLFEARLKGSITGHEYIAETRTLRETVEAELKKAHFFHYSQADATLVLGIKTEWGDITKKFPSADRDINSGVDCVAIGHGNAAVFHFMRVAECGLRALARERSVRLKKGKPLEWGDWQTIIDATEKQADKFGTRPAGRARDAALEFYRGSARVSPGEEEDEVIGNLS